jgi:hypothetical protein
MSGFFDKIEQKHGGIPAGEHQVRIIPKTAQTWARGDQKGVTFKVGVVDGANMGRTGDISITLDGPYSSIIASSTKPLREWAEGVHADLSQVGDDPCKVVAAIRKASERKQVYATFVEELGKNGRRYIKLAGVRVEEVVAHARIF